MSAPDERAEGERAEAAGERAEAVASERAEAVVGEPAETIAAELDHDEPQAPAEHPILRIWASVEMAIASVFLVITFVTVMWQVISRYAPVLSWPGAGELANYSLIVITFIMVGYLVGRNGHITIQIIDYVVKGRAFVVIKVLSAVFTAVICAVLAYEAYSLILAYPNRTTAALEIPVWMLYAVPLVGFASGVVRAIVRIFTAHRPDPVFETAEAS
jgi:TRAP-type C4-dicarboxylate transport system permease small subunit